MTTRATPLSAVKTMWEVSSLRVLMASHSFLEMLLGVGLLLSFNSNHPISAKRAVVRALMDRASNVCSSPDNLAKEVEHLSKVLCYNNYPQWLIDKWGRSDQNTPLLHLETGLEIKKQFFISVPYYPGFSEAFKKVFKYTHIQVCFKGANMLKSLLMHPKDKVSLEQKKDLVYHWQCQADWCKSSYVVETSRSHRERAKEHSKSTTSAIHKHCTDHHHPLPSVSNFAIIDKDPTQITWEAKEAIHIQRLDPDLNRNIGKMFILHCFDPLIGVKPKHPQVDHLSQLPGPVDEMAPPSQVPGLNLTQFNDIRNFRPDPHALIAKCSTWVCMAKNLQN